MQFTQSNFLRKCELRLFSFQYTFSFSRFIQHFEADFNVVYIFVFKLQRAFVDVTFNYIWVNNSKLLITNIDGIKIHKKICQETLFFRRRKNSEQKNHGFLFVLSIFGERRVFLYNGHDASVSTEFEGHCVGPLSLSVSCPNWWSFRAGQIISTKVFENQ